MSVKESTECRWVQDDLEGDTWGTSCGHYFRLDDGTPADNDMKFCCYCGKTLIEALFEEESSGT